MNTMNTRMMVCLLGLGMLCACAARTEEGEPAGDEPITPVYQADAPAIIDGVLDEPFWKQAMVVRADYPDGKVGQLGDRRMAVRFAWDAHYLYIGYETFDKNLTAEGSGERQGPEGNQRDGAKIWDNEKKIDVVEYFISFDDPYFFWEIHQNALNQWNDVWCIVPPKDWPLAKNGMLSHGIFFGFENYIRDEKEHTWAAAVTLKPKADGTPSTVNDDSDEDTGYIGEIRLPLGGVGAPDACRRYVQRLPRRPGGKPWKEHVGWNMGGQTLRILSVVQDAHIRPRYHHSSPTRKGGWLHKCFSDWPRYRFVEGPPPKGQ